MTATGSTSHHVPLCVDLVLVKPPLRPRHEQNDKICEQATQFDMFTERSKGHVTMTKQHESDDGAETFLSQPQHSTQLLMGFLVNSSSTKNICSTSRTNHFTDTRHATIDATQYYRYTDSLAHCRPTMRRRSGALSMPLDKV